MMGMGEPTPKAEKGMTINRVVALCPDTLSVFAKHNVDACCGGFNTVEAGAKAGGVDPDLLVRDLNRVIEFVRQHRK